MALNIIGDNNVTFMIISIPDHGRERGIEVVRDKSDTRDPVFVVE